MKYTYGGLHYEAAAPIESPLIELMSHERFKDQAIEQAGQIWAATLEQINTLRQTREQGLAPPSPLDLGKQLFRFGPKSERALQLPNGAQSVVDCLHQRVTFLQQICHPDQLAKSNLSSQDQKKITDFVAGVGDRLIPAMLNQVRRNEMMVRNLIALSIGLDQVKNPSPAVQFQNDAVKSMLYLMAGRELPSGPIPRITGELAQAAISGNTQQFQAVVQQGVSVLLQHRNQSAPPPIEKKSGLIGWLQRVFPTPKPTEYVKAIEWVRKQEELETKGKAAHQMTNNGHFNQHIERRACLVAEQLLQPFRAPRFAEIPVSDAALTIPRPR